MNCPYFNSFAMTIYWRSAFLEAFFGTRLLKKVTRLPIQAIVGVMLIIVGFIMVSFAQ